MCDQIKSWFISLVHSSAHDPNLSVLDIAKTE